MHTARYTSTSLAYQEIKSWILMGEVPASIRLREEKIAERIGVSRTPVREAFLRLHGERFLERHIDGGYRVATPSAKLIRELYEVRRALEIFAIRRTIETGADRDLTMLRQLEEDWLVLREDYHSPDPEFVLLDEDFHGRLAESAGNRQLAEELRRVNERIRPVRSHDFVTSGRLAATVEQHLKILGALIAGDGVKAQDRLDRHIRESQEIVEAASFIALAKMLNAAEEKEANQW